MIQFMCDTCGAAFDRPYVRVSTEFIDGHIRKDIEELCPICYDCHFSQANTCECGRAKKENDFLCDICKKSLLHRFMEFADELTEEEEDQLDDWLDGMSIKSRRQWNYG